MEISNQKGTRLALWLVLLGVVLRLLWVFAVPTLPVSDFDFYFRSASNIAAGAGYSLNGAETAFFPVGYPALLGGLFALTGPSVLAGQLLNVLFSAGCLWLIYLLSLRFTGSQWIALLTLGLMIFHPNQLVYASLLASEPAFQFFLLLGVWLAFQGQSRRSWLWAGVAFAVAGLIRPVGLVVPVLLLLADRRAVGLRPVLAMGVVMLVCIAPWAWRNKQLFGSFVLVSTNGGYNLLVGNNPVSDGRYAINEQVVAGLPEEYRRAALDPERYLWAPNATVNEAKMDKAMTAEAVEYIKSDPLKFFGLMPRRVHLTYERATDGTFWVREGLPSDSSRFSRLLVEVMSFFSHQGFRLLKILFCVYLLLAWCRSGPVWRRAVLATAILALFFYTNIPSFGSLRSVAYPTVALMAAFGLVWLWRRVELPSLHPAAFWLIGGFTFFYLPFFGGARFHHPIAPFFVLAVAVLLAGVWRQKEKGGEGTLTALR